MSLSKVQILNFPKLSDARGDLSFVEYPQHIPFEMKRIFYLYKISDNESRGNHAHKQLEQIFIPLAGAFQAILDDGKTKQSFQLDKPWQGIYIPPMIWTELTDFLPSSVCLVLASDTYKEEDYHRNYQDFIADVNSRN
jgi:hypothetical protein